MNWKRLLVTVVLVWLASHVTGFLIHGIILAGDYKTLVDQKIYSSPDQFQSRAFFLVAAYLAYALGTVWIYAKGVDAKPWPGQGVRFGLAVWLVLAVPSFGIAYVVQPIPGMLVAKQLSWELLNKIFLGVLTAALYRRASLDMENRILAERAAFMR